MGQADERAQIELVFKSFDADGSGHLDEEELLRFMGTLGQNPTPEKAPVALPSARKFWKLPLFRNPTSILGRPRR